MQINPSTNDRDTVPAAANTNIERFGAGGSSLAAAGIAPTPMEEYLFDLNGFIVLRNAIAPDHLREINAGLDTILSLDPPLQKGEWYGGVLAHSFGGKDGVNLQHIYEGGEPFERLIDHPAWIGKLKRFVGGHPANFDWQHGPLFIDENFANIRGPGEAIGLHSGGEMPVKRCQYWYHNGEFSCGQINVLMGFNDIGPGDGATMVIPGSHKSNFRHPDFEKHKITSGSSSADAVEGAVEVHLRAGDALLFVDAISHGSAARVNPGQRRIAVFRYGPSWGNFRHPYAPAPEFLARLTPERRRIVQPQAPIPRVPNRLPAP